MTRLRNLALGAVIVAAVGVVLRLAPQQAAVAEEPAPAATHKTDNPIAVCDVWTLTYTLATSDRYAERRSEYEKIGDELEPVWEKIEALHKAMENLEPDDEEWDQKRDEYMRLYDDYEERYDSFSELQDRVFGEIVADARKLVVESTRAVATDLGYRYVLASTNVERPEDKDGPKSYRNAWQRHVADQVILFPEGTDITEDVKDDLKLD